MITTANLARVAGVARSLAIYYGQPWKVRRRRAFYREFIRPGSLCFDVGAHVGNRIGAWLSLGARVIAVEPQPDMLAVLRFLYGNNPGVELRSCALGSAPGTMDLHISSATPTVSSLSNPWMQEVQRDPRFATIRWDRSVTVTVETLDRLIGQHGEPEFCKIDVEGFEFDVLQGLTRPLRAMSFEFIPVSNERAIACVERIESLGAYVFRPSPVETMHWATRDWLQPAEIKQWLRGLPMSSGSGDVYARRVQ